MKLFAPHLADFYKIGHIRQYVPGTDEMYSNFTARGLSHAQVLPDFDNKTVWVGLQGKLQVLHDIWKTSFFDRPRQEVLARFQRRMDYSLGPKAIDTQAMGALHDLGFLPLHIKALPEGSRVNLRVPTLTVRNTRPGFAWCTNYIESQLSAEFWKTPTNATLAYEFRRMLDNFCELTGGIKQFVRWQGHDFAFRGMSGVHDATSSAIAHLLCFTGTDTISALDYLEDYYLADASTEALGGSVPATEHSVVTMNGPEGEVEFAKRLMTELYPKGVVSNVSDSYDFWWMVTEGLKQLKPTILARQPDMFGLNKYVIRPDSGEPVLIINGDPKAAHGSPEHKGVLRCIAEVFDPGTTATAKTRTGHLLFDPHIGVIYGDAITLERGLQINHQMLQNGFCSSNMVYGIGSYSYQHVTRDSYNHAYKATNAVVDGLQRPIYKDPKTDSGMKKSARGYLRVEREGADFVLYDNQSPEQERRGALRDVYIDGRFPNQETWRTIRERLIPDFYAM